MIQERKNGGFTLLEIMISFTILGMLVLILLSGLRLGTQAWEKSEQRIDLAQRIRIISDIISREIVSAYPYKTKNENNKTFLQFCLKEDRLDFISTAPSLRPFEKTDLIGLKEVSFFISEDEEHKGLVMREAAIGGEKPFDDERGTIIELDDSVKSINFEIIPFDTDEEEQKLLKLNNIDWCYPEDDQKGIDHSDLDGVSGLTDEQKERIKKMREEGILPKGIAITLTFIDYFTQNEEEISLPTFYFPIWSTRTFEYPREGEKTTNEIKGSGQPPAFQPLEKSGQSDQFPFSR